MVNAVVVLASTINWQARSTVVDTAPVFVCLSSPSMYHRQVPFSAISNRKIWNSPATAMSSKSTLVDVVSPVVVLEVKADLVSRDAKNNLGLRFPRCIRIRDDKFVVDINTLKDVERLE